MPEVRGDAGLTAIASIRPVNLLPIIQRELRVASRQHATWRLRLSFAAGAVLACSVGILWPDVLPRERGIAVLICLAVAGLALSLFAGSYLTADCVSVEKREGTLGLLFLTPLAGWQIILGKMVSHAFQVSFAWLAIFPVFFVPILHGGVTWAEVTRLLLALLVTLLLSLACGIFWSTVSTEARTAVMASAATMLALTFLPWLPLFVRSGFLNRGFRWDPFALLSPMTQVVQAFEANYSLAGRAGPASGSTVFWGATLIGIAFGAALVGASGWLLPRLWRRTEAGGPAGRKAKIRHAKYPKRRNGGTGWAEALQALPCRWLASRGVGETVWLRVLRYLFVSGFALMLLISVSTRNWEEGFITAFCLAYGLHLIARGQVALAVTRRLNEDRRSGALELLLVTPVTEWEVVEAHHTALRHAFRGLFRTLLGMNIALQAMVVLFPGQLHMTGGEWAIFSAFFVGGAVLTVTDFRALRWLGLREGLVAPTHVKAAGRTFARLSVVPWLAFIPTFIMAVQFREEEMAALVFAAWVVFGVFYGNYLVRRSRRWLKPGLRRRVAEPGVGSRK